MPISSLFRQLILGYQDRRETIKLNRLSNYDLKDIGLTRSDVSNALAEPITGSPIQALRNARFARKLHRSTGLQTFRSSTRKSLVTAKCG